MRFSAATLLTMAASATAASTRSLGSWAITMDVTEATGKQDITAIFTGSSFPKGLSTTCVYDPSKTPADKHCDRKTFGFNYDGTTLEVIQHFDEPESEELSGQAAFKPTQDLGNGKKRGTVTIDVTKAVA